MLKSAIFNIGWGN